MLPDPKLVAELSTALGHVTVIHKGKGSIPSFDIEFPGPILYHRSIQSFQDPFASKYLSTLSSILFRFPGIYRTKEGGGGEFTYISF